jgi:hypothetical protein
VLNVELKANKLKLIQRRLEKTKNVEYSAGYFDDKAKVTAGKRQEDI